MRLQLPAIEYPLFHLIVKGPALVRIAVPRGDELVDDLFDVSCELIIIVDFFIALADLNDGPDWHLVFFG